MHENPYVFAQLVSFLDRNHFNYLVRKYSGDHYVKHFTCWNQLLVQMFGQISNREGLRALIVAFDAHRSKCYHLGVGRHVTRSNLAKANENRDFRIFKDFAYHMIELARKKREKKISGSRGTSMRLTRRRLISVWNFSNGRSFARQREASKSIRSSMSRLKFPRSC